MTDGPMTEGPVITSWRAPGRVNLIGEHTDYNSGFALPMAIEAGCTATIARGDGDELIIRSVQEDDEVRVGRAELAPGRVTGWGAYPAGVVWALGRRGIDVPGLDVRVDGDVPLGAGLSSSAALSCSVAAAVNDLLGADLSRADLVAVARSAENDFVGAPTGGMDQLASVFCVADHALLCDMRSLTTRSVPFDLAAAGLVLVIADTRAPHRHADGEYAARRQSCEQAAELLGVASLREVQDADHDAILRRLGELGGDDADVLVRRVRHILTENARVLQVVDLLDRHEIDAIGPLLTASHASMREDFEITAVEVDVAVTSALAAGALGARMTGGGFGGCVISLVAQAQADDVEARLTRDFAGAGFAAPQIWRARAGPGTHARPV